MCWKVAMKHLKNEAKNGGVVCKNRTYVRLKSLEMRGVLMKKKFNRGSENNDPEEKYYGAVKFLRRDKL